MEHAIKMLCAWYVGFVMRTDPQISQIAQMKSRLFCSMEYPGHQENQVFPSVCSYLRSSALHLWMRSVNLRIFLRSIFVVISRNFDIPDAEAQMKGILKSR